MLCFPRFIPNMTGFRMEQSSGQEMEQQPVIVMTDVLDNIAKVPGTWGVEKEEFMTERDNDLLDDDKQQHNSLCIGEPGAGKTALTGDIAVHTYTQLANARSEEMPHMDNLPTMPNGAPLSILAFGWSDVIKAAVAAGAVVPKEYGAWDDNDLSTFTRGGERALAIARKGKEGIMGTDGNYTSSAHMDIAMVTAARNRKGDLVGRNRFFTAAEHVAQDPSTGPRLRVAAVVTDAESFLSRMTSRLDIDTIQTEEDLYIWLKAYGMMATDEDIAWLLQYLPKSFADVRAASLLRAQTNETLLALNGDAYELPHAHVHLLQDEIRILGEGNLVTDRDIIASHDERNTILTGSFYPHLLQGLVTEERGLICANPDTAEVNLHPSVMRGNWISQLQAYNKRVLFTP